MRTVLGVVFVLAATAGHAEPGTGVHSTATARRAGNPEAVIPPQCYTRTQGRFNPCYVCHQDRAPGDDRPNFQRDAYLQGRYAFSDVGLENHWTNLFVDRRAAVAAMPDREIRAYVAQDNYAPLAPRLRAQGFRGWVPDLAGLAFPRQAFDAQGFARDASGWVAFSYKPLPSTFWPTNGSTDDVMIRLPEAFRRDRDWQPARDVYLANLTALEAAIKNLPTLSVPGLDERAVGADLDADGALGTAHTLRRPAHYFGAAAAVPVEPWLYPVGTEFLHTVRYVGVMPDGTIHAPPRMKEVRYLRKEERFAPEHLAALYDEEAWDKTGGFLPRLGWQGEHGALNGFGWRLAGFIEDAAGELRAQNYEETLLCKGCHATLGATVDQTFAFPRKVDGAAGWGYLDLRGMRDAPRRGQTDGEILEYLRRAGGGDEFRHNGEMRARWFRPDGSVDAARVRAADVYSLITPSPRRALDLNKAYRLIVREQSFVRGRDATLTPARNVYRRVDPNLPPLAPEHRAAGGIILDWTAPPTPARVP